MTVISETPHTDLRIAARTAGIALIVMAVAAFFSYSFIHGSLVVQDDAAATYRNIASSGTLFRVEILGWIMILASDIAVAWALYHFLKPVHASLSLLGAWLRLIYACMLGTAILNLVYASSLTDRRNDALLLFPPNQLEAHTMLYLDAFETFWFVGLILFGMHLAVVGWLVLRARAIPKILGILLLAAAAGYAIVHLGYVLLPGYRIVTVIEYVFMAPMFAGELGFGLWLLFRGGKSSS